MMISLAGRLFPYQANSSLLARRHNRRLGTDQTEFHQWRPFSRAAAGNDRVPALASGDCRLMSRNHACSRKPTSFERLIILLTLPVIYCLARLVDAVG